MITLKSAGSPGSAGSNTSATGLDAVMALGMRALILDRLVEAERASFNDDGKQGRALNLPEPKQRP